MKKLAIITFCAVVLSACAHSQKQSAGEIAVNEDVAAEEAVIHKLPVQKAGDIGMEGEIPVEINSEVEKWIGYFQGRGRGYFERYLERSTRYIPMMSKILKDNGVPEDLIYIAMIESGFSGKIKSRAKAVGFWQFMGYTGKHYGLKVSNLLDERYDPVRSTEAAAAYFKGLYSLFGNWYLAIASYNVGENRIKHMVMKNMTRNFWELARKKQLPQETQSYIPKYIAAKLIAREPEKYGFTGLDYQAAMTFDVITSNDAVDLKKLANGLKISFQDLRDLNPALKTQYAPVIGDQAIVRVPVGMGGQAKNELSGSAVKDRKFLAQAQSFSGPSVLKYRVQRGDTLEKIANRYDLTVDDLLKVNRVRRNRIRPGTLLKIPNSSYSVDRETNKTFAAKEERKPAAVSVESSTDANASARFDSLVYVVRRGDTLTRIARRHRITLNDLLKENNFDRKTKVRKGQKITIPKNS